MLPKSTNLKIFYEVDDPLDTSDSHVTLFFAQFGLVDLTSPSIGGSPGDSPRKR